MEENMNPEQEQPKLVVLKDKESAELKEISEQQRSDIGAFVNKVAPKVGEQVQQALDELVASGKPVNIMTLLGASLKKVFAPDGAVRQTEIELKQEQQKSLDSGRDSSND